MKQNLVVGEPFNPAQLFGMFKGTLIPDDLVENKNISDSVKILMGKLIQYSLGNRTVWQYRKVLAKECGWSTTKLDRVVRKAKELGLIQTKPYTGKEVNQDSPPNEYIIKYSLGEV